MREFLIDRLKSIRTVDYIILGLVSLLVTGVGMVIPVLTKQLTGRVVDDKDMTLFWALSAAFVFAALLSEAMKVVKRLLSVRLSGINERAVLSLQMKKLLFMPSKFYGKYPAGQLGRMFESFARLNEGVLMGVAFSVIGSLTSLSFGYWLFVYGKSLFLPALILIAVGEVVRNITGIYGMKLAKQRALISSEEEARAYSYIKGIGRLRTAGAEREAYDKWGKLYESYIKLRYEPPMLIRISPVFATAIKALGVVVLYVLASKEGMAVSDYLAFSSAYAGLSAAAGGISDCITKLYELAPTLELCRPIIETEPDFGGDNKFSDYSGELELSHVSFGYGDEPVLTDISLHLYPGDYLGIAGRTGSGKSTLLRLILGLDRPDSGEILYDGIEMSDIDTESLMDHVGAVMQDGRIFSTTIRENITITDDTISERRIKAAIKQAGLWEEVDSLPLKLDTPISEGSGGFSGGQKQRLMIARAIAKRPALLVLDEATSSVDASAERTISESIDAIGCTRIVVAHRPSTLKNCHRIIYIEDGRIAESGSFAKLMEMRGKFYKMVMGE